MTDEDERVQATAHMVADAAAAFLTEWRRGEDVTSALDAAEDLDDALAEWRFALEAQSRRDEED